jgi:hypothetical protein
MVEILMCAAGGLAALALAAPGVAGSAEERITKDLEWSGGESFGVSMAATTTFIQGPTAKIVITGPEDVLKRVVLDGDTVKLKGWGGWSMWPTANDGQVTIVASAPHVREFKAASNASIDLGALREPNLTLRASKSGSIRGVIRTDALDAKADSSGKVVVTGSADKVTVNVSKSGQVDLYAMSVQDAVVRADSEGGANLGPTRSADVSASKSARVRLFTRPPELKTDAATSGTISVEP